MPDLKKSLKGRDLGHLRIVAEMWGIEMDVPDARAGVNRLAAGMLDGELAAELVEDLSQDARSALYELLTSQENRLSWAKFERRFGTVREMGPARRDRDQPYRSPVSAAEVLWYRGLVGRAFFDTPRGPEEFAYIPDDLVPLLPVASAKPPDELGRAATPGERANILPVSDILLDHACSLLAALRIGFPPQELQALEVGWSAVFRHALPRHRQVPVDLPALTVPVLRALLSAAGLLDPGGVPYPGETRQFLNAGRGQALAQLARAWMHSDSFNELLLLPGLAAEGEWQNDPLRTRQTVLDFLATVPGASAETEAEGGGLGAAPGPIFWSLDSFVDAIRQTYPDFQRPAGDYDSWYLRDEDTGEYLRGFENWGRVDGALVRFTITGPLHWLGVLDLAYPEFGEGETSPFSSDQVTAFRFSKWGRALLEAQPPAGLVKETAEVQVRSDARIFVPRQAPRSTRYQLARFTEWEPEKVEGYTYRLTPGSLSQARLQGLKTNHLLRLLGRRAQSVAPSLVRAIERWERVGVEARFQQALVLRLSSPELLQKLRASKAGRFLGDPLGPTTVVVKTGALEKVMSVLAELGYLGQVDTPDE